jgi:NAD(P)-dependent dehydrogenase (short-subunit alcohol dehydrogenase family)
MSRNKHVVITGGAKGIGASCAKLFSRENYTVSILDTDEVAGKALADEIGASFYACDIASSRDVEHTFKSLLTDNGDIDVLVNNAGINIYGTVTETTDEVWDRTMNINLKGHFLCARAAIPSMQRIGKGVVVNVSSVQAFISQNSVAAYTTSKTAQLGLTRSIAVDYAPNIRCVAICPGTVDTPMLRNAIQESPNPEEVLQECHDMHLTKRVGTPEEVAELILFVSSDKAGFITGQAIRIDGGLGIVVGGSKRDE